MFSNYDDSNIELVLNVSVIFAFILKDSRCQVWKVNPVITEAYGYLACDLLAIFCFVLNCYKVDNINFRNKKNENVYVLLFWFVFDAPNKMSVHIDLRMSARKYEHLVYATPATLTKVLW